MNYDPEYFPTPRAIALKMMAKICKDAQNILEPQAGGGALAEIARGADTHESYKKRVDCIEINPDMAHVLRGKDFPVVGYDWLTYAGVSYYDAIVMNPPFSNGDEHLLKAWDFLHDGEIVCLLNQDTIDNPHTERRQRLVKIIMDHGTVEPLGNCFARADRKTLMLVCKETAPGSCHRHKAIAVELLERGIDCHHLFENEIVPASELQKSFDNERYDYKSTPWSLKQ